MKKFGLGLFVAGAMSATTTVANAENLDVLLNGLLSKHERIQAAQNDVASADEGKKIARAAYLPSLDLSADSGYEKQLKHSADNTSTGFYEVGLTATQLIYDFGKTFNAMDTAELRKRQALLSLEKAKQSLILEAVNAYIGLVSAYDSVRYANLYLENMKKVTGVEEFKVDRGSGVGSDVLQAKGQLAAANANFITARNALTSAVNRYRTVFGEEPGNLKDLKRPKLPMSLVPKDLQGALDLAKKRNLDLNLAKLSAEISGLSVSSKKADLYAPTIEMTASTKYKNNVSGTLGGKTENLVKVNLSYPFYTGGKDMATYNSTLYSQASTNLRNQELHRTVEESVRQAWQNASSAKTNLDFRRNQSNIMSEFLQMARKERQLNKRSLVDVLRAENNLISASTQMVGQESAWALAVFNLLYATAQLDENVISLLYASGETDMKTKVQ